MNKQFLNTQIEGLARRSQNRISELGGIEQLLDFYDKHKSFLSIPKAGRFTNEELSSFCNYLISKGVEKIESDFDENQKLPDMDNCIAIYENEKSLLSARANNGLNKIELQNNYNASVENKAEHIKKLFFSKFDFLKLQNMGPKSKLEFESLKQKISSGIWNNEMHKIEDFKLEIYQSKNKAFSIYLNDKEREEVFINGMYSFKKMLCIFLLSTNKIKKLANELLINNFFSDYPLDRKILSEKLKCSIERIRQIDRYFYEVTIPWAVNSVLDSFIAKPYDLPENNRIEILHLANFPEFIFRGINYTPNAELSKSVYSYILKYNYELIDNIIQSSFKSFEIPETYFFVSKKFIEETELFKLLDWLDDQIYHFEVVAFEYRLEVLIERYYDENHKAISERSLQTLHSIIKSIKKRNFELDENALKKITKKSRIDSILNEVYLFLKEKNEGQMTNVILDYLNQKNFAIEKEDLLRYLNNNKSTFSSFGMGNWTLVEWKNNNDKIVGSFRNIVRNLLSKRTEPIHTSELYEYINSMKKVSLQSMISNLRSETEGTFKFFNCSYIGLSEKKYSAYWHQIPKFKAVHLNKELLSINNKDQRDIVKYINSKFGYPEQHLFFILDCKSGKYGKREKEN